MTSPLRKTKLGVYCLGKENVELWVCVGDGNGAFFVQGPTGGMPRIELEVDPKAPWDYVMQLLLHETREMCAYRLGLHFHRTYEYLQCVGNALYVYDHTQGAEMDMRQATFLAAALPDLSAWYRRAKRLA